MWRIVGSGRATRRPAASIPSAETGRPTRRRLVQQMAGAAAAALAPSAVRAAPALPQPDTLEPGVLRIGTYFVNPPFEFIADGKKVGFEVDLLDEIAQQLGLRPDFVDTRWETILQEMQERRYDCIVGGITITPERRRTLAWSEPYMTTTLSLVVDAAASPPGTTLDDLRGARVGVQAATTDYDAALAMQKAGRIGEVKVYPFAQIADAMSDLTAGRVKAVMKVYPVAAWFVRRTPTLRILAQVPDDPQPLGIGFSPGTAGSINSLMVAVDAALADMQRDGRYAAIAQRWDLA
ncbi:ABC transporter substrate-binding protein [Methylobacterium oryzisoli]|uniref:ABC transporter substrate-binding protein n=1 Tax=Methylobacterium oryzisoli TaxID=3385502 RepID=UPI003891E0E8